MASGIPFEYKDMAHPYYLLPGAPPWSSVAPTILFKKKIPYLVVGSPGSERIATSLAQVIMRVVDDGESLDQAVAAPRLHAGKAGQVQIEKSRPVSPSDFDDVPKSFRGNQSRGSSLSFGQGIDTRGALR